MRLERYGLAPGSLEGIPVLIVEDDPLLLVDPESTLASAGATPVGFYQKLHEALPWSEARFCCGGASNLATKRYQIIARNADEPSFAEWRQDLSQRRA